MSSYPTLFGEQPQCLYGAVTGLSGDSSLLEGVHPHINKEGLVNLGSASETTRKTGAWGWRTNGWHRAPNELGEWQLFPEVVVTVKSYHHFAKHHLPHPFQAQELAKRLATSQSTLMNKGC